MLTGVNRLIGDFQPEIAEACAVLFELSMAAETGIKPVCLETDTANVVKLLADVSVFGQSTAPTSGYGFGSAAPSNPFQFFSQQNMASPQNSSLFQASHSLEFNAAAEGSFSLGTGDGDKSQRKIVRVKGKSRKK
ncbi:hypothetical protein ACOSQ2_008255 [Xanthoceras sorbifolium]